MLISYTLKDSAGNEIGSVDNNKSDMNRLSFVFGVGGDYQITDQLYIRLTAGVGIGLPTKAEKDAKFEGTIIQIPIKLCVGYNF
jgi:hypothetical protein